jgi:hypothetical protein
MHMSKYEPSKIMQEIGAKLYPRRYRRFKDLRTYQESCDWARTLDWKKNPYDRYLLRRELLHYLESTEFYKGGQNVFKFASRKEIAAEVDRLMDGFSDEYKRIGVFAYIVTSLPWHLAFKHGIAEQSRLAAALAKLEG